MKPDLQCDLLKEIIGVGWVSHERGNTPSYGYRVAIHQGRKAFRLSSKRQFDQGAVFIGCQRWVHSDLLVSSFTHLQSSSPAMDNRKTGK
jgi:hypothetical protein